MPLPLPPDRTGETETDLEATFSYFNDLIRFFPNAVGSALDPSLGEGGDSSLTVDDIPTNFVLTSGTELTPQDGLAGFIDVAFTKPDRAVDMLVLYRSVSESVSKQSYASTSPVRLRNLTPGETYVIQLSGQSANGSIGPFSAEQQVTVLSTLTLTAPFNLTAIGSYQSIYLSWSIGINLAAVYFVVQRADDTLFTVNVLNYTAAINNFINTVIINTPYFYRVKAVDNFGNESAWSNTVSSSGVNVPDDSITFSKLQNISGLRLLGNSSGVTADVEEISLTAPLQFNATSLRINPNTGWSTSGITPRKTATNTDTLADVINTVGTIIDTLKTMGIFSA